jgi:hypothetical protein
VVLLAVGGTHRSRALADTSLHAGQHPAPDMNILTKRGAHFNTRGLLFPKNKRFGPESHP